MSALVIMVGMSKKTADFIKMQVSNDKTTAEITIFGAIGRDWWNDVNNSAQRIMRDLDSLTNIKKINLKLTTTGGSFLDGLPIYNLFSAHPATIDIEIMGYCLSMGTHIMLAASKNGGKIRAYQNSIIMMHNAQGVGFGSQHDLRKTANVLAVHEQAVIPRYRERMGLSEKEVQALLDKETWYSADQALAVGLIDEIIDPVDLDDIDKSMPENSWKYAAKNFKNPPPEFLQRIENAAEPSKPWVMAMLEKAVGKVTLIKPHEDETVEQKDIDAIAAKTAAIMKASESTETPPANEPVGMTVEEQATLQSALATMTAERDTLKSDNETAVAEVTTLKSEKEALEAKVAELSKPADGQETPPPGDGPAGDTAEHFS